VDRLGEEGAGGSAGEGGRGLGGEEDGTDRPSTALGITRGMVVCEITSDMEPNMPIRCVRLRRSER
jgi:hypothetical protein